MATRTGYFIRITAFYWSCIAEAFHRSWKLKSLLYGVVSLLIPVLIKVLHEPILTALVSTANEYWWLPFAGFVLIFLLSFSNVVYQRYELLENQLPKSTEHPIAIESTMRQFRPNERIIGVRLTNIGPTTITDLKLYVTHISHQKIMEWMDKPISFPTDDMLNPGESADNGLLQLQFDNSNVRLTISSPNCVHNLFNLEKLSYEFRVRVTAKDMPSREVPFWIALNPPYAHVTNAQPIPQPAA